MASESLGVWGEGADENICDFRVGSMAIMESMAAAARIPTPMYLASTLRRYGQKAFAKLQNDVGLPVLVDRTGGYFSDSDQGYELFPCVGLEAFVRAVLEGGECPARCSLQPFCSQEPVATYVRYAEARCAKPWLRSDEEQLCPVAVWSRRFVFPGRKVRVAR
jgi:hypothetical protein